MESFTLKIFLIILTVTSSVNSYYLIPFKFESINNPLNDEEYLYQQILIQPYTYIKLGNPAQKIFSYFRLDYTCSFFANNFVPYSDSIYNESKSNTFKNTSLWWWGYGGLNDLCKAKEEVNLLKNNKTEVTIELEEIFYSNTNKAEDNNTYPGGVIGLGMSNNELVYCKSFVDLLKNSDKSLDMNSFSVRFYNQKYKKNEEKFNGYDGEFLFNILPHQIDNISFTEADYKTNKIEGSVSDRKFKLEFDNVYIKLNNDSDEKIYLKDNKATTIRFNFNLGIIICREEYFNLTKNYVFNELINENICKENIYSLTSNQKRYYSISCDKEKIIKKYKNLNNFYSNFPTLYIESKIFNYTFSLNGFELFFELNNQIIFNIVKDINGINADGWILGKIFLQKYYFVFDYSSFQVGFYDSNPFGEKVNKINKKETTNYLVVLKAMIIIICVIVCIVIGFLIGKKFYEQKKKRANELNDDYEYNVNKEDNNNKLVEDGNENEPKSGV